MMVPPAKKLEDLIHLAELCVDLLQQNEEHYAEVSRTRVVVQLISSLNVVNCFYVSTRLINVVTLITNLK